MATNLSLGYFVTLVEFYLGYKFGGHRYHGSGAKWIYVIRVEKNKSGKRRAVQSKLTVVEGLESEMTPAKFGVYTCGGSRAKSIYVRGG